MRGVIGTAVHLDPGTELIEALAQFIGRRAQRYAAVVVVILCRQHRGAALRDRKHGVGILIKPECSAKIFWRGTEGLQQAWHGLGKVTHERRLAVGKRLLFSRGHMKLAGIERTDCGLQRLQRLAELQRNSLTGQVRCNRRSLRPR